MQLFKVWFDEITQSVVAYVFFDFLLSNINLMYFHESKLVQFNVAASKGQDTAHSSFIARFAIACDFIPFTQSLLIPQNSLNFKQNNTIQRQGLLSGGKHHSSLSHFNLSRRICCISRNLLYGFNLPGIFVALKELNQKSNIASFPSSCNAWTTTAASDHRKLTARKL